MVGDPGQGVSRLDRVAQRPEPARQGFLGQEHLGVLGGEVKGHLVHEGAVAFGGDEVPGGPGGQDVFAGTSRANRVSTHEMTLSLFDSVEEWRVEAAKLSLLGTKINFFLMM